MNLHSLQPIFHHVIAPIIVIGITFVLIFILDAIKKKQDY